MRRILLFFFLLFAISAEAQSWDKATIEKQLCREWHIDQMVVDGKNMDPEDADLEGEMIFHADHTATNSQDDDTAKWSYDAAQKGIWMTVPGEEGEEEKMLMKILSISADKLVLDMSDEEEKIQMHLSAVKK